MCVIDMNFPFYTTYISLLLPLYYTNIFTQNLADSRFHLDPMGKMRSRAEEIKGKKGREEKRKEGREGEEESSTLHHDNKLNYHWLRNAPEGNYRSDNTEELHESNISRATDGKSCASSKAIEGTSTWSSSSLYTSTTS